MVIIVYKKNFHNSIIQTCAKALKLGKIAAYPTDTCYGLAVDATNPKAIKKLYRLKGRNFNKPVHIVPPSISYVKKIVIWNSAASRLAKEFFPGPLTLVLKLRGKALASRNFRLLSAGIGFLGIRMPKNSIALDLARVLKRPVTTTSANVSGQKDNYSAKDVARQFENQKLKPDLIIDAGQSPKRRPSTVVKLEGPNVKILRRGPVPETQIKKILK